MTRTMRTFVVAAATAAIVTAANASEGAYFSQSWGWVALAFQIPTTLALILERATIPGRHRAVFALLMLLFAAWIALSALWSVSPAGSIRELERMLVYAAVALALAFVLRRGDAVGVAAGVTVGIALVSTYGLATRLVPDRLDTRDDPTLPYRLSEPLGYWNALGLLAAMGLLVALGFVAHSRRAWPGVAAALALPVLAATLYFTFSRGAWAALFFGLGGMIALDPRRLRLLWAAIVVTPATVACVAYASRQSALTTEDAPTADAVAEGRRMVLVLVVLALCSGLLAGSAFAIARRVAIPRGAVRAANVVLASLAVIAAGLVVAAAGGPYNAASELKARFDAEPVTGVDLNARLFSASGNGRGESIRVAWEAFRDRPALGHGAGSYEYIWYERRETQLVIRDAHSLYAEVLSELGAVGLAFLCAALLIPLVAAFHARRSRFVAAGAGAYLAWLAASALDWHWETVSVTLAALLAAGVALLAADRRRPTPLTTRTRVVVLAGSIVLTVLSLVSLVGNQALFAGREALARKEWASAAEHARRAQALLIWSYEPELVLGDAAAGLGEREIALDAYRDAVKTDPRNWVAWLRLAQVARGAERVAAYARVHELNPLEENLPGESARNSG